MLLHVTSLPSRFGIGDLGPDSRRFVDLLSSSNQRYWNILPLTPTSLAYGSSPYQPDSAFAGNTLLISPEILFENGLLSRDFVGRQPTLPSDRVDYRAVTAAKTAMIREAYRVFKGSGMPDVYSCSFEEFCSEEAAWLDDFALFRALRERNRKPWYVWPRSLRDRDEKTLETKRRELREVVERVKFGQFVFFGQLKQLKEYCRSKNVGLFGDTPFYVAYNSVDVWSHPRLFKLDSQKKLEFASGVPPDYFSRTGQLWGNPVYRWKELKVSNYEWWINRIRHALRTLDLLRLDHFRGFVSYWQVLASAKTAKHGHWVSVPSDDFFRAIKRSLPDLPLVAEDLGVITPRVREVLRHWGIAGMRVLLFAFDGNKGNPHLPSNYVRNCVAFTGTHDTNTVRGWFNQEASSQQKRTMFRIIGRSVNEAEVSYEFIKLALESRADVVITPIQDVLSLGADARMNNPAKQYGNWEWRLTSDQLNGRVFERLSDLRESAGRT